MKTFNTLAAVLAAASSVFAAPSPSEELAPRQSSLTAITVKGNGEMMIDLGKHESTY
jgi:1,3-beta-glucanosyltransferase GAS5